MVNKLKKLEAQNIPSKFILARVTDENVIKIVEDVLPNEIILI